MAPFKIILFVLATIGIVWVSRASLRDMRSHGFYRFLAWETILLLFLLNMEYWFIDPFSFVHIVSWAFLIISLVLIYQGVQLFRKKGKLDQQRSDPTLVGIEKTTELVTTGLYAYIRHPFYSSLLFLGWGILLKDIRWVALFLALLCTLFLILTAKIEERENIQYFGEKYQGYMQRTKMFIPLIF